MYEPFVSFPWLWNWHVPVFWPRDVGGGMWDYSTPGPLNISHQILCWFPRQLPWLIDSQTCQDITSVILSVSWDFLVQIAHMILTKPGLLALKAEARLTSRDYRRALKTDLHLAEWEISGSWESMPSSELLTCSLCKAHLSYSECSGGAWQI